SLKQLRGHLVVELRGQPVVERVRIPHHSHSHQDVLVVDHSLRIHQEDVSDEAIKSEEAIEWERIPLLRVEEDLPEVLHMQWAALADQLVDDVVAAPLPIELLLRESLLRAGTNSPPACIPRSRPESTRPVPATISL
ncbi:hypothetical protein PMAYCL1PPCAC_14470, partial [Pristionchus mayeri]